MVPLVASADWNQLNLTRGVTPYSEEVYQLHMLMLWVCVITGIGVFGVIFYSIIKFRKSKGAVAAQWHENTLVEFLWTAVPAVILVVTAIPATKALVMMEDVARSDMTIKVTGYQWRWRYDYVNEGVFLYSGLARTSDVARQLNSGIDPKTVDNYRLEVDRDLRLGLRRSSRAGRAGEPARGSGGGGARDGERLAFQEVLDPVRDEPVKRRNRRQSKPTRPKCRKRCQSRKRRFPMARKRSCRPALLSTFRAGEKAWPI
jgi:hypothetical protein